MHDVTAARLAGIGRCLRTFDRVQVLLDDGYLGLSRDHRGKALTQPRKLRPGATPPFIEHNERQRHEHSSQRITVEHALADHKRWKHLQRWTHRRDRLPDTYQRSPLWYLTAAPPPDGRREQGRSSPVISRCTGDAGIADTRASILLSSAATFGRSTHRSFVGDIVPAWRFRWPRA